MRAHDAEPHELAVGALHRHGPRESVRRDVSAEVQFDRAKAARAELALRGVQIRARQPEPEAPLKSVGRAAGEHGKARANRLAAGDGVDTVGVDIE